MTGIRTVDYHTGGEPFRIVVGGADIPEGTTILDRRSDALERLDHVRRLLVNEPRGHADMYGCHVVPPVARPSAEDDLVRRLGGVEHDDVAEVARRSGLHEQR